MIIRDLDELIKLTEIQGDWICGDPYECPWGLYHYDSPPELCNESCPWFSVIHYLKELKEKLND